MQPGSPLCRLSTPILQRQAVFLPQTHARGVDLASLSLQFKARFKVAKAKGFSLDFHQALHEYCNKGVTEDLFLRERKNTHENCSLDPRVQSICTVQRVTVVHCSRRPGTSRCDLQHITCGLLPGRLIRAATHKIYLLKWACKYFIKFAIFYKITIWCNKKNKLAS